MHTISVTLTTEQQQFVDQVIASGRYKDQDDVMRAAIYRWQRWEQLQQQKLAAVNQAIEEGIASGVAEGTIDDIFERVMARSGLPKQAA